VDDRGVGVLFMAGERDFSLLHNVQTCSGAHPGSYAMGTETISPGVKRPGREVYYTRPPSGEVKHCGFVLHSAYVFMARN
jgi:hypothetical protein